MSAIRQSSLFTGAGPSRSPSLSNQNSIEETRSDDSEKGIEDRKTHVVCNEAPVPPPVPSADAGPPVDTGADAWMTAAGAWCLLFATFGWLNSVGVLQTYYEQDALSDYSPASIAWIASTNIFVFFFGSPFYGRVFDSYGPSRILIVGSFLHVLGLFMLSLGSKYYQFFLAQSICSACGASGIAFAAINATSTWFRKRRATALGLSTSGASFGGVIFPIMLTRLTARIGFGWAMRATAFLVLVLLAVGVSTTKSRLKHTPVRFNPVEFIRPFHELPFLLLALASFSFYFGNFLPFNYIDLQSQTRGVSPDVASYLIPLLNAGGVFGRILPGHLADLFGCFNLMIIITLTSVVAVLGLWIPGYGTAPIVVFALLYGFCSGAYTTLVPALVAQISDIRQIGVRNGANYALLSLAALTGNPIGGALIGKDHSSYLYMQIFTGLAMALGTGFFLASRTAKIGFTLGVF